MALTFKGGTIKLSDGKSINFKAIYYTVTFKDWDGTVLKIEPVDPGGDATPPADPTRTGSYSFSGWSGTYTGVTSNRTITATYILNIIGQALYSTPGTYTWTAPTGVTSVCVVAIGGGGGGNSESGAGGHSGGGGGLGYKNNITVVPGNGYTVVVGVGGAIGLANLPGGDGGDSYFLNNTTVKGGGGQGGEYNRQAYGGSYVGTGGGNGGKSGAAHTSLYDTNGAGGAGGYAGNGGQGGDYNTDNATAGAGGGGGGGGAGGSSDAAGAGGGVGVYGQGANGEAGVYNASDATGGKGGSGGGDALTFDGGPEITRGGIYGGGGGGAELTNENGPGGQGAVRIIWGNGRAFPSTLTTDQS